MGRYRDHIVPRLVELSCGAKGIDRWRVSAMDGLAGRVIEIGFGSGLNVPHYPEAVTEVLAVEPAATARKIAEARIGASRIPIVHSVHSFFSAPPASARPSLPRHSPNSSSRTRTHSSAST